MITNVLVMLLPPLIALISSLIILSLIFYPLERVFPARPHQKLFRANWLTDLAFFAGQYLLWGSISVLFLELLRPMLGALMPPAILRDLAALPWALRALLAVILGDALIYWVHRVQHSWSLLWRFHSVHHSAQQLDWLAAHREHPIDGIVTQTVVNLPALLLGFSLSGLGGFIAFRGVWAIYIHSNVKLPIGALKYLLGSPEIHHWHHAQTEVASNFANLSPMMDILFGTFKCPSMLPDKMGISEPHANTYFGLLLTPLIPKRLRRSRNPGD